MKNKNINRMSLKDMWNYVAYQTQDYTLYKTIFVVGMFASIINPYYLSFMSAILLNCLLNMQYNKAKTVVIVMVSISGIFLCVSQASVRLLEHYAKLASLRIRERALFKSFELKMEQLESKEVIQLLRRIKSGERGNGGIEVQLKNIYKYFSACLEVFISIVFMGYLFFKLLYQKQEYLLVMVFIFVIVLTMAVVLGINQRVSNEVGKLNNDMCRRNEELNSIGNYLYETIEDEQNLSTIKIFNMVEYFEKKLKNYFFLGREYTRFGHIKGVKNGMLTLGYYTLCGMSYFFISLIAIKKMITIGEVVMYVSAIMSLFDGMQTVMRLKTGIAYKNDYLKNYESFITDSTTSITNGDKHFDGSSPWIINIKHLYFKYPNTDTYVFSDLNLTIEEGRRIGLVGLNGSGKSTLVKLLCRLYTPDKGSIELNGIKIEEINRKDYYKFLTAVFQDFQLFDFPIKENVLSGKKDESNRFYDVIKRVGLAGVIEKLADKENTIINHQNGEGAAFSGGELQKMAIARAIYKDASLYILDEPTAALDPISESDIYSKMNNIVENKTVIFVSHRMSSCKFCDTIVVLQDGSIKECGTHKELINQEGLYYEMYMAQEKMYTA